MQAMETLTVEGYPGRHYTLSGAADAEESPEVNCNTSADHSHGARGPITWVDAAQISPLHVINDIPMHHDYGFWDAERMVRPNMLQEPMHTPACSITRDLALHPDDCAG